MSQSLKVNAAGHLEIGQCDTVMLASEFGTPLYVMDEDMMRSRMQEYRREMAQQLPTGIVAYAGKAFLTTAMCRLVASEGLWLDVVSGGELYTAVTAGFPTARILFHGNNKTDDELMLGLEAGVGRFVVDNFRELERLAELARKKHVRPGVLLRVAPGVTGHTHQYIQTGQVDSKFGFPLVEGVHGLWAAVARTLASESLALRGLHSHIGSQINELEPFAREASALMQTMVEIRRRFGVVLPELDVGGGLGSRYSKEDNPPAIGAYIEAIAAAVTAVARQYEYPLPMVIVEPGRSIVAEAGITLYTIGAKKVIPDVRTYLAVDGGMGDNPRPALYHATYQAVVANKANAKATEIVTIAGKHCESGDILIWDAELAPTEPGDVLAVLSTGAYNYSMASNYNRVPRPAVVFVHGGEAELVVRRESYADIVRNDVIPARLESRAAAGGLARP